MKVLDFVTYTTSIRIGADVIGANLEVNVMSDNPTQETAQRAQAALLASPLMALRQLLVEPSQDRILISGRVSTFYQKQQAQELVRAEIPGVMVVNEVQVS